MMKTWIKKRWLSSQTAIQYIQNNALTSYGRESGAKIMTLSYLLNINSYFFETFFKLRAMYEKALKIGVNFSKLISQTRQTIFAQASP